MPPAAMPEMETDKSNHPLGGLLLVLLAIVCCLGPLLGIAAGGTIVAFFATRAIPLLGFSALLLAAILIIAVRSRKVRS